MKKMFLHNEEPIRPFYVMNEYAEYWAGLRFGKARFSDDFNEARTLERDEQFKSLQHLSDYKIEKIYI